MSAQIAPAASPSAPLIKLGANGAHLPADATGHLAVLDVNAGLMRAVGVCPHRIDQADTDALIAKLNAESYAGFNDWRIPTRMEELLAVDEKRYSPVIDTEFYPDAQSAWYRTSTETPWSSDGVFCVGFSFGLGSGHVYALDRYDEAFVRPVRSVSPGQ